MKAQLLAVLMDTAVCVSEREAAVLYQRNTVVLDALRKIRQAETAFGDETRLRQLDDKISKQR